MRVGDEGGRGRKGLEGYYMYVRQFSTEEIGETAG